jgi:photosynthetic reaction center cytochrome c subunit
MKINNKLIVIGSLCGIVIVLSAAANKGTPPDDRYKNLQVLPKDISEAQMNKIMLSEFSDGLGVSCGFCHAANEEGDGLDFVSDAKPEKLIARQMLRMTLAINHDYFKIDSAMLATPNIIVTCNTCHKGESFPDGDPGKN